ncbi:MAG: DinB family protein [Calditrichaeota bacterium]|nr:DinB family protein [Calditrichota bacterium]MBT7788260.1 DinB family protein [Calditrichota bacterium]
MNWTELLRGTFEYQYDVASKLMAMVSDDEVDWKPATGENWMTMGQLLHHITNACGSGVAGFVTGKWGMPEGFDPADMPEDEMLPSADKLPTIKYLLKAQRMLLMDKELSLEMLGRCSEERLNTEIAKAPWDQMEMLLGQRLLQMANHLEQHKGQLFYYLKLMGKPVNTMHLWGV